MTRTLELALALALGTLINTTMGKLPANIRAGRASSSTTGTVPTVPRATHDESAARARASRSSSAAEDVALPSREQAAVEALAGIGRSSRSRSAAMYQQTSAAGTSTAARGGGDGDDEEAILSVEELAAAAKQQRQQRQRQRPRGSVPNLGPVALGPARHELGRPVMHGSGADRRSAREL